MVRAQNLAIDNLSHSHAHHRLIVLGIAIHIVIISLSLTVVMYKKVDANQLVSQLAARWNGPFLGHEEPTEPITFLFTGDVMLGRYIAVLSKRNGGDFPFTYMPELLEAAETELEDELDFVVGNLEGPITDSSYVNPGTAMIFNFDPDVVPAQLQSAGFTTLSMANNHTLDMGADGIDQTFQYLSEVGIDGYGHPDTPEGPYSTITYHVQGKSITFLGLNDAVTRLDFDAALEKIRQLDAQTDFLILSVHWGTEYTEEASARTTDMAHQFVDAGVDFIHGTHPHRIQNQEIYNGVPIYYSLGNFVFDQYWASYTQEGQVVMLKLTPTDEGFTVESQDWTVDLVNQGEPKLRQ